ncbi:MAG: flagellar export chaperone FliS [Candidatus Latescibacteria bacterium]|nr:flagellar export chaperone FliS [Candidatus Latescibacterota bacterium]
MVSRAQYQAVYRQVQVGTSGREKLIILLYNGAIVALQQARELVRVRDYVGKGKVIFKAQDIVLELSLCLNDDYGTFATNLRRLYAYIYRRLSEANTGADPLPIEEALHLLTKLRDAWALATTGVATQEHREQAGTVA